MARLAAALLLALTLASAGPAEAWAPRTRLRIADEAIRFMPASLRLVLEHQREEVRRGLLEPLRDETAPGHRTESAGSSLAESIAVEAGLLSEALERPVPFAPAARRFGRLAHFVLDAGYPPGAAEPSDARRFAHFAEFCESRREKFPLVFYGHDDGALAEGDYDAFARALIARSRAEDLQLARAYAAAGEPPDPAAFDDRSVPFAIGSLSYSRSVTDLVRVWLSVWERAGGDMGRTPYRASR